MNSRFWLLIIVLGAFLLFGGERRPDEGMWLPGSIGDLPLGEMQKRGLRLSPEDIYSTHKPSIKDAIVLLGGGTASFVSPEGLMITNHHVAFSGIQSLSSVQQDYLKNGFRARTRGEELPTTYNAQIVESMKDVTADIVSANNESMTPEDRAKAIRVKSAAIEAAARGSTDNVCRVSSAYSGNRYYLTTLLLLKDVRLVYAPPGAIGNFGGEVDNWMWPRHTGDFSFMRAYVGKDGKPAPYSAENIPYKPAMFLPISTRGYSQDSFAMILGFPGRTFRYREAAGIEVARDVLMPATIDLYKTRMDVIEKAGRADRAVQIKYASRLRMMANTYKNYLGTLEGMRRSDLLARKREEEREFGLYLRSTPGLSDAYGTLLADLGHTDSSAGRLERERLLLRNLFLGVDLLRIASRIASTWPEATKDSSGNLLSARDAPSDDLQKFLATTYRDYDEGVDKETLLRLLLKSAEMPEDQHLRLLRTIAGNGTGEDRAAMVRQFVDNLYAGSALASRQGCENFLKGDSATIAGDEGMKFAAGVNAERLPLLADSARVNVTLEQLRGKYLNAWLTWKKRDFLYPDANRTLRFTYGRVEGYRPRDAVDYSFCTTLTGVMEKEGEEEPFTVPAKLRDLWVKKDFGPYADRKLGDVPVAFISNLDITGGNSGSPVINGTGELIGCAFDGNWESIVGDYVFEERYDRTISVDARYILFVLDKFSGAENILKELVIH